MKKFVISAVAAAITVLGASPAVATAAPSDNPNERLIQTPARAFPTVYQNVSPERSFVPKYTGTVLTTTQTRQLRGSGVLAFAKDLAPYNYNGFAASIQTKAAEALALRPAGCIRIYYTPRGKDPRFPAYYVAAVINKFCNPPNLLP